MTYTVNHKGRGFDDGCKQCISIRSIAACIVSRSAASDVITDDELAHCEMQMPRLLRLLGHCAICFVSEMTEPLPKISKQSVRDGTGGIVVCSEAQEFFKTAGSFWAMLKWRLKVWNFQLNLFFFCEVNGWKLDGY